ncbi:MAG: DNA-directed RNA polymerase subunit omega [Lachnospiraceae bacterium]|nr:DNA-directed RNA polymerase subunit omega [Lachnospiraceae bacterium]
MIHPSYKDLMNAVNANVEPGEEPVVNSRYSIVIACAKRARQIVDGAEPLVQIDCLKPLSIAVKEIEEGQVKILTGANDKEDISDYAVGFDEIEEKASSEQ